MSRGTNLNGKERPCRGPVVMGHWRTDVHLPSRQHHPAVRRRNTILKTPRTQSPQYHVALRTPHTVDTPFGRNDACREQLFALLQRAGGHVQRDGLDTNAKKYQVIAHATPRRPVHMKSHCGQRT